MLLMIAAALQAPAALPPGTPFGEQTVIASVSADGLREWRRDPTRPDIAYVRDRRERWYQVTFTGPCEGFRTTETFGYDTAPGGNFDRFSRVRLGSAPQVVCGIQGIRRSTAPASQG